MVQLECPHCEEVIELDDGDYGLYSCPHCDDEFEYENEEDLLTGVPTFVDSDPYKGGDYATFNAQIPMNEFLAGLSITPTLFFLGLLTEGLFIMPSVIIGVSAVIIGLATGKKMFAIGGICGLLSIPFIFFIWCAM